MQAHELITKHARAFERNDWAAVREHWHPDAELISPSGRWPATHMAEIMTDLRAHYADIAISVTNVFASEDGTQIALEWTYASTRRRDGARSSTPDAIIVTLRDGLIVSWREYFDLSTSVELGERPPAAEHRHVDALRD
jgi:ketosteroid isomerase-like protein